MSEKSIEMKRMLPKIDSFEVHEFYTRVIDVWRPKSQVWPFAYGDDAAASISLASSFYITHHFRKELKIRPYAKLTCYSPTMGLGTMCTLVFQSIFVTGDILREKCPMCVTTKAVIGQLTLGIAYPLVISPLVCFFLADKLLTYPIAPLVKAPREIFKLWLKIVRKNPKPLFVLSAIHAVGVTVLTHYKQETFFELKNMFSTKNEQDN